MSAPSQPLVLTPTTNSTSQLGVQSGVAMTPVTQDASSPWSSINFAQGGEIRGTPKPNDAPSGTKPIDKVGLSKDAVHQIKDIIGAGARDWVGKAPNGDIITGTRDGKIVNHGPIEPYGN